MEDLDNMTNNTVYRYLGYGTTDSTGTAKLDHDANGDPLTHSYTGVGAGEIDVLASLDNPIASGSIVSEPSTVLDALFYDDGVSDSISNYYINSPTNLTRTVSQDGTGTELENIHQSNTYYDRAIKVDTPTPSSLSDSKVFTGDLYIEFEKVSQTGTGTGSPSFQVGGFSRFLSNYSEGIIKFTVEDGKIYRYGTDDTKVDTGTTVTGAYEVGFIVPASAKIKYKNWKIYPI